MKTIFIGLGLVASSIYADQDIEITNASEISQTIEMPMLVKNTSKTALLGTDTVDLPKDQRPYDYDLFSKDRETEYLDLEGMFYKLLNNQAVGARSLSPTQAPDPKTSEKILDLDWDWRPAFRVTVGYFNAPKYWEVMGQYTWFQDRASLAEHVDTTSDNYLRVGCYLPNEFTLAAQPVTDISASARLYYNDLSTLVTRNFYPNPHLRLRVVGGLTSVWTHQTTELTNTFYSTPNQLICNFDAKYWGVGFRMGTGADWYWGKDFYLTGKVFWSIVTGRWNTNTKISGSDGTLYYEPSDDGYQACQNFTFIFGPSYQKSYDKFRWELFLGYEFNNWLNMLNMYNYQAQTYSQSWSYPQQFNQDLTLTGVNLRLTLDF